MSEPEEPLPTYTVNELREMVTYFMAQIPVANRLKTQATSRSVTAVFTWTKALPVVGRNDPMTPCAKGFAHLVGQAPGLMLQLASQLLTVLNAGGQEEHSSHP